MLIKLGNQRYLANSEKKANSIKMQLTYQNKKAGL